MAGKKQHPRRNPNFEYRNYNYAKSDLAEAEEAAAWEGITITDYFRSALKHRLRETNVKRAEHERRMKGERDAAT